MPLARARIAVCPMGPPSSVTNATTCCGSSSARSAGARSWVTRTYGPSVAGMPGTVTDISRATARSRTSSRSLTRAERWSLAPESSSRKKPKDSYTARAAVSPAEMPTLTSPARSGSRAMRAWAFRTSLASPPTAWARDSSSRPTSSRAASARAVSASGSPENGSAGGSGTAPRTTRTGPTPTPGLTPVPSSSRIRLREPREQPRQLVQDLLGALALGPPGCSWRSPVRRRTCPR
jgi:hypothetical protein